jgi:hypothetical protein
MGKSLIAALMALFSLARKKTQKVYMIFTSQRLLERDQADFQALWSRGGLANQLEYCNGINGLTPAANSILIIDEADELIY